MNNTSLSDPTKTGVKPIKYLTISLDVGGMATKKKQSQGQLSFSFGAEKAPAKRKPKAKKKTAKSTAAKSSATSRPARRAKKKKPAPKTARPKAPPCHIAPEHIEAKARAMANNQREISISEFFAKNRHLLGFDNPRKALLTAVKEAVDNSLDACEEAHILPQIEIGIDQTGEDRYRVWVQDNGPGIVKQQIPNIFGRLLYGSKFHTLRMARGQQGIGISAAGMYGLITTGKSVKITSRTGPSSKAHYYELQINTKKNRPEIIADSVVEWDASTGTRVEIEMEARYQRGRQSVDEYLVQTALANPHTQIRYVMPDGQVRDYPRSVQQVVTVPKAVKPHPYGVELGVFMKMAKDTPQKTMVSFLCKEFSRVSTRVSQNILEKAKLKPCKNPHSLAHADVDRLYRAINNVKIMAPSTNCVAPIGEESLQRGIEQVVAGEFYTVCTRPPTVYRGNPFQIEAALCYGGNGYSASNSSETEPAGRSNNGQEQELMRVLRFANRVPLLYQQSACAMFRAIMQTNWRLYGLSQSRGALPAGPVTIMVHIASVWVPFTSESKEAVAHYPEIIKEIKLALADCGRRLGRYRRGQRRAREEALKRSYIEKYLPAIGEALRDILTLNDKQVTTVVNRLEEVLERSRSK